MQTECLDKTFVFQPLDRRDVVGRFDGGTITSDAGAPLLREVDRATSIIEKFAVCFSDFRTQCGTIRLKLLKIGAQVRVTCRKVWISMASGYPYIELFAHVLRKLRALSPLPAS